MWWSRFNFKGFAGEISKTGIITFIVAIILQILIFLASDFGYISLKLSFRGQGYGIIVNAAIAGIVGHIIHAMVAKPYPDKSDKNK